jgi:hypothetical protein
MGESTNAATHRIASAFAQKHPSDTVHLKQTIENPLRWEVQSLGDSWEKTDLAALALA